MNILGHKNFHENNIYVPLASAPFYIATLLKQNKFSPSHLIATLVASYVISLAVGGIVLLMHIFIFRYTLYIDKQSWILFIMYCDL